MAGRGTKTRTGAPGPESSAPFLAFPLYKSHGLFYHKLEMNKMSLKYYTKAQELEPQDETPLIEKSRAEVLIGEYKKALNDALAALEINKDNLDASYMRSVSLFMKGEIEQALMHFHRGLALRKHPPIFEEGVLGMIETDEICIGRHAGSILLQFMDAIKKLEEKRKKAQLEEFKAFSYKSKEKKALPKDLATQTTQHDVQDWWTLKKQESIMSSRYLGRMSHDYHFLKHLEKDPRMIAGHKEHTKQLASIVKETVNIVNQTKEILRVRKPFYAVKRMETTTAEILKERKKRKLESKIVETKNEAINMIDKLRKDKESGNIKKYIENAMKVKAFLDQKPIKILPNKDIYLDTVYNLTGLAYMDQFKIDPSLERLEVIEMIEKDYDIVKEPYHAAASRKHTKGVYGHRQMLAKCEADLEIAQSLLEKTWLYYEITKASLGLGLKIEIVRNASKKCLRGAQSLKNVPWIINALVMASKVEMKSLNRAEAKAFLKDAIDYAEKLDMPDLKEYLEMATEVVDLSSLEGQTDMIGVRQKRILSIMADATLRVAAEGLFNYMDNMPVARRMSIVPGVKRSQMPMKRRMSKVGQMSLSPVPSTQKIRAVAFESGGKS